MRIISNTNKKNDRMKKLVIDQSTQGTEIHIASAFFTEYDILKKMDDNNCYVLLIVRLNSGTSPKAIKDAFTLKNVSIRFFTEKSFHPKFYIFGKRIAYVGSSNFTFSGLTTNQEVNIEIDGEESVFDDLNNVFFEYWNAAKPLEIEHVRNFERIIAKLQPTPNPTNDIHSKIGKYEFNNVGLQAPKGDGKISFIDSFKREYQLYIKKFGILSELFESFRLRKFPSVPLRIEVDSFLGWIRDYHAKGDSYKDVEIRTINQLKILLSPLIIEFNASNSNSLNTQSVLRYETLITNFASPQNINGLSIDDIIETLNYVYAFHDRLRYFPGGWNTLVEQFRTRNSEEQIKNTISYLLYGEKEYHERIYECIYGDYKLLEFGANSVTELFGLVNNNNIPILNGRTRKSMEWLGFGKI